MVSAREFEEAARKFSEELKSLEVSDSGMNTHHRDDLKMEKGRRR
jgi:hypothetical protein